MQLVKVFLFLCIPFITTAQFLDNPSFEGEPMDAVVPAGWSPCNDFSTPDILPGVWGVHLEPSHGKTYVGLITRMDGSVEGIGQRTPITLKANTCYSLTMDLAYSHTYSGYTHPAKCKVWLAKDQCVKEMLIVDTDLITHNFWKTYTWKFEPEEDYDFIILEAYYPDGDFYVKGNILIDNIRPLRECGGA